jgi:serine/threonine protein kinase
VQQSKRQRYACRLYDVLYRPTEVVLALEFLDCNLRELLRNTGPLSVVLAKSFTHQILQGLAYAKAKRCLHRDLKPANILVLPRQGVVKIADFGLGRAHDFDGGKYTRQVQSHWLFLHIAHINQPCIASEHIARARPSNSLHDELAANLNNKVAMCCFMTCSLQVMTLRYRAPEIMLGMREYNAAVDMWSVGCIMSEMLLGDTPFQGENEVDQLMKIFEQLGRPSVEQWPEVSKCENFNEAFPNWRRPADLTKVPPRTGHPT